MSDLISRSALIEKLKLHCHDYDQRNTAGHIANAIFQECMMIAYTQPIIEATTIAHSEWKNGCCTNCGQVDFSKPNFCSNCGADMRGKLKTS